MSKSWRRALLAVTIAVLSLASACMLFLGRSTVLVLVEQEVGGVTVTLVADSFGRGTTSDGSGGLWEPYKLGDTPAQLVNKWGAETYEYLQVGGLWCLHACALSPLSLLVLLLQIFVCGCDSGRRAAGGPGIAWRRWCMRCRACTIRRRAARRA